MQKCTLTVFDNTQSIGSPHSTQTLLMDVTLTTHRLKWENRQSHQLRSAYLKTARKLIWSETRNRSGKRTKRETCNMVAQLASIENRFWFSIDVTLRWKALARPYSRWWKFMSTTTERPYDTNELRSRMMVPLIGEMDKGPKTFVDYGHWMLISRLVIVLLNLFLNSIVSLWMRQKDHQIYFRSIYVSLIVRDWDSSHFILNFSWDFDPYYIYWIFALRSVTK